MDYVNAALYNEQDVQLVVNAICKHIIQKVLSSSSCPCAYVRLTPTAKIYAHFTSRMLPVTGKSYHFENIRQLIDEKANENPNGIGHNNAKTKAFTYSKNYKCVRIQVAQALLQKGFTRKERVSILSIDGIDAMYLMIGVLKAGRHVLAAPLIPIFIERSTFMLQDSESTTC
ncbi:hypothetical protein CW304_12065 [Bacillus sp. UFRGS-B20]|nr:hypothetical protein CW304_12065 [Bacillus sp. UFRGS-B20]